MSRYLDIYFSLCYPICVENRKGAIEITEKEKAETQRAIMLGLRTCGHFLHFNMGGKAGRKRVLAVLLREGEITQRTLQDLLDIQSGSLSELLAKIEADGLLEKVKCGSDRRGYILRLTESGRELAKQVTAFHEARVDKLLDCLDDDEQSALLAMLDKLTLHWSSDEVASMFKKQNPSGEMTQL